MSYPARAEGLVNRIYWFHWYYIYSHSRTGNFVMALQAGIETRLTLADVISLSPAYDSTSAQEQTHVYYVSIGYTFVLSDTEVCSSLEELCIKRVATVISFDKMLNSFAGERIYFHPQTDCFVISQLFSMARHTRRSKPELCEYPLDEGVSVCVKLNRSNGYLSICARIHIIHSSCIYLCVVINLNKYLHCVHLSKIV